MRTALRFACALDREARLAERLGDVVVTGSNCKNVPSDPVVAFGYAGSLRDDWHPGTVVVATRVISITGRVVWERDPLPACERFSIRDAKFGTVLGHDEIIDDPEERRFLYSELKADVVTTEAHRYPHLRGCILGITDYPKRPLGLLALALDARGEMKRDVIKRAFRDSPWQSLCVSVNSIKADRALGRVNIVFNE